MASGVTNPTGVIEYPRLREKQQVSWNEADLQKIEKWVSDIEAILKSRTPPDVINARICKSCSYEDFCYSE